MSATENVAKGLPAGLYIVATPIGNLDDITLRAISTLKAADRILAEDTRHSRRLFNALGFMPDQVDSNHEHNELRNVNLHLQRIRDGEAIALISDAGTPLINDPGYRLVCAARDAGLAVWPIPGASSIICALSAAGLPTSKFTFEGFVPHKSSQMNQVFSALVTDERTLVFLVPTHSVSIAIETAAKVFGEQRPAVLARELTKRYETFLGRTLGGIGEQLASDDNQQRGEFVLMIRGAEASVGREVDAEIVTLLKNIMPAMPPKQAAAAVADAFSLDKRVLYQLLVELKSASASS